ncbi:MAG: hypothetical protein HGA98_00900, partial [Deltaproteobacteria bacterium]|nr:hypothetical protein [Deltaproteobacteria bacterium]
VAVLQPVAGAWLFPAAFAAMAALSPHAVAFAVPLAMTLGGGVIPTLIGELGERGAFGLGIGLVGVLCLAGAGLAILLPKGPAAAPGAAEP